MDKIVRLLLLGILAASMMVTYLPVAKPAAAHTQSLANPIIENGWEISWTNTGSAMLELNNVKWKGTDATYNTVITKTRVPSIYVDYPTGPSDVLDKVGAAELTHLHKVAVTNGFRLEAEYIYGCATWPTYGCYKYEQQWMFKNDGTFFPWMEVYGPGLRSGWGGPSFGDPHYVIRWYFNTAIDGTSDDGFAHYESSGWVKPTQEDKKAAATPYSGSFDWKMFDYPESGTGTSEAFSVDPWEADNPTMHYLRYYSSQIDIPLCTTPSETNCDNVETQKIGSPAKWDNNESIQSTSAGQDNVEWYITRHNAASCANGSQACFPGGSWQATGFP